MGNHTETIRFRKLNRLLDVGMLGCWDVGMSFTVLWLQLAAKIEQFCRLFVLFHLNLIENSKNDHDQNANIPA